VSRQRKPLAVHDCKETLSYVQCCYFMEAGNLRSMW